MIKGLRAATARSPTRKAVTVETLAAAGLSISGTESPEDGARLLSAVDRCIEILSDSVAKLPAYVMDRSSREHVPHSILRLLNDRPNEAMTPFIRKKVLETSRLEGGNAYDWIVRDPRTAAPVELIPIPWQLVQPWRDMSGRVWYDVTHPITGEAMRLPQEDICHYKNATRGGLKGISTLARAAEVISTARAAQQYDLSYYNNGGQPSGVLQTDSDLSGYAKGADGKVLFRPDGSAVSLKDQLRSQWERVHMGPSNAHRVAILDLGLEYKPLSASNRDAQFVENKQLSVTDIARYFGVPLYKLNEGKQAYGSNEQNAIEYVVSTLHPIITQYEEELSYKLLTDSELARYEIRINMMAELKGDTASRAAWYRAMSELSVFCPDDICALEDIPNVPGGHLRRASLNYVPLDMWEELSRLRNGGGSPGKEE
nr:MAG TPA: portal protein [Caudoviricetes sp.]